VAFIGKDLLGSEPEGVDRACNPWEKASVVEEGSAVVFT
jgi:hypothetical protein